MKFFFLLLAIFSIFLSPTKSIADENFSQPRFQSLLCDLVISAYKKTIKSGRQGGNRTLAECPGYQNKTGKQNNFNSSKNLIRIAKKKPARVVNGGVGAEGMWKLLLLEGTPQDIINALLNEKEFWAAAEEMNKRPENIRKNKGKKIIIERH